MGRDADRSAGVTLTLGCLSVFIVALLCIAANVAWWLWLYPSILRWLGWF